MKLPTIPSMLPCDGCTDCCIVTGVREIGKPYYCDCIHIKDSKCNIYESRPDSCAEFHCLWQTGIFGRGTDFRPDNFGLLFDIEEESGKTWIAIYETRPHDRPNPRLLELLDRLVTSGYPFHGAKYYKHDAKVGVQYPLKPPYPEETYGVGTSYGQPDGMPDFLFYIGPHKPLGSVPNPKE